MVDEASLWALRRQHVATVVLSATALVYALVGVLTFNYPPDYLGLSQVWAGVHVAASVTICLFLIFKRKWLASVAGGLSIGAALFRSLAIFVQVGHGTGDVFLGGGNPVRSSFVIAACTWALIALLLWAVWPLSAFALMEKKD